MGRRQDLHDILKAIPGVTAAYFQAPSTEKMQYPCIVYERDDTYKAHADNNPYMYEYRYQLTVMAWDPDSPIFEAIERLPKCRFVRFFAKDKLNHQVFNIYF